ncbi:MAG: gamma-glutamyl-gamma-aminobutyrate hydrolase family protein [Solirubrobacteraceae bacterium]
MPASLLVIQNDPDKSLGRLADGLQSAGARLDVRSPAAELPDVREYDGLIVLPGLANPVDDTVEIRRARDGIEGALEAGLPILGLCLGGQLLAQALGGSVHLCQHELGFGDVEALPAAAGDPLLASAPGQFPIFHAHTFAFTPPEGAEVLLVNDVCVQACRHGEAWAFQCHPEIAGDWVAALAAGLRGRDGQLLPATTGFFHSNGVNAEQLEHDAAAAEPAMQALADGIAGGFAGRLA